MNKKLKFSINLSMITIFVIIFYLVYRLLLQDNPLHLSIAAIIAYSHHLTHGPHLVLIGLLPFYVASIIFGATLTSLLLGATLQQFLRRITASHKNLPSG